MSVKKVSLLSLENLPKLIPGKKRKAMLEVNRMPNKNIKKESENGKGSCSKFATPKTFELSLFVFVLTKAAVFHPPLAVPPVPAVPGTT